MQNFRTMSGHVSGCRPPVGIRQPCQLRRHPKLVVSAGRTAGHEKRSSKSEDATKKCPCGSGLQYQDCCGPIVSGAWARTAPELARARFTALITNKPQMLADTTHPEALAAIGTKHSLLKRMEKLMRQRGADDDDDLRPALIDCIHGQSPDDPDSWYVMIALSYGQPGLEGTYVIAELYRKDAGRWWYVEMPPSFPILDQFSDFLGRYHDPEDWGVEPVTSRYAYTWFALPPRRKSALWAQHRTPWLVDDWPADQKPQDQAQPGQAQSGRATQAAAQAAKLLQQQRSQGGWVYLDTAVDPKTGLNAAQTAARNRKLLDAALQGQEFDYESYYFRFGRFMGA